jgi:hypothetical protein
MDREAGLALDEAVRQGDLENAELLLHHGARLEFSRPIHMLVRHKVKEWRPLLDMHLRHGVDIDARKASRLVPEKPLHYAMHMRQWDLAEYLLLHGADPFIESGAKYGDAFAVAEKAMTDVNSKKAREAEPANKAEKIAEGKA